MLQPPPAPAASHAPARCTCQSAVTRRSEAEQASSSALNQALPFAPTVAFEDMLLLGQPDAQAAAAPTQQGANSSSASRGGSAGSDGAHGDVIRRQDLVLWVTSGLMHLPGSEDAPVTPTTVRRHVHACVWRACMPDARRACVSCVLGRLHVRVCLLSS